MSDESGAPRPRPALSPSRAADFKQCPLLYRFRAIDRLPEPPSTAQLRGSVVHAALEQLYSLPATQRGPQTAGALVGPAWEQLVAEQPELLGELDSEQQTQLLDEARALLSGYYRLEDPTRFDRRVAGRRLQDRQGATGSAGARRVQGHVPDEVLRRRVTALAGRAADAAATHLPGRWPATGLLTRRRRVAALREDADRNLAGNSIRRCNRRFQAPTVAAVRLVPTPRTLPRLRRHTAAVSGLAGAS
jgi:PD-(D/E)XK nuclease superfamily